MGHKTDDGLVQVVAGDAHNVIERRDSESLHEVVCSMKSERRTNPSVWAQTLNKVTAYKIIRDTHTQRYSAARRVPYLVPGGSDLVRQT
jgi:hypothetical protein